LWIETERILKHTRHIHRIGRVPQVQWLIEWCSIECIFHACNGRYIPKAYIGVIEYNSIHKQIVQGRNGRRQVVRNTLEICSTIEGALDVNQFGTVPLHNMLQVLNSLPGEDGRECGESLASDRVCSSREEYMLNRIVDVSIPPIHHQ